MVDDDEVPDAEEVPELAVSWRVVGRRNGEWFRSHVYNERRSVLYKQNTIDFRTGGSLCRNCFDIQSIQSNQSAK